MKRMAITLALVGAGTIGLANTSHAMTLPAPSALKEAVPSNTSQVFWRGGGWGGGGAAVGSRNWLWNCGRCAHGGCHSQLALLGRRILGWLSRLWLCAGLRLWLRAGHSYAYAPAYGYAPLTYSPAYSTPMEPDT